MNTVTLNWRQTTIHGIPARKEETAYSQVPCLVIKQKQILILVLNHEHMCWYDESGDDHDCEIGEVQYWCPLSELEL